MARVPLSCPYRCKTCGEYIYKGKKFNARKETVQNEAYLGLPIFRFYIKCTRCLAEITFKVGSPPGWPLLPWGYPLLSSLARQSHSPLCPGNRQRFGGMFVTALFIKAKNYKQPRCTIIGDSINSGILHGQ